MMIKTARTELARRTGAHNISTMHGPQGQLRVGEA